MHNCSLCASEINTEQPPILTVGAYGTPKYICEACASAIDDMTTSRELDKISAAFDRISDAVVQNTESDGTVNRVITEIMEKSRIRAERIKDGSYDFSEDEECEEIPEDIPEELAEAPEDIEQDEREQKRNKKIDKIVNIIFTAALVAIAIYAIIKLF